MKFIWKCQQGNNRRHSNVIKKVSNVLKFHTLYMIWMTICIFGCLGENFHQILFAPWGFCVCKQMFSNKMSDLFLCGFLLFSRFLSFCWYSFFILLLTWKTWNEFLQVWLFAQNSFNLNWSRLKFYAFSQVSTLTEKLITFEDKKWK